MKYFGIIFNEYETPVCFPRWNLLSAPSEEESKDVSFWLKSLDESSKKLLEDNPNYQLGPVFREHDIN